MATNTIINAAKVKAEAKLLVAEEKAKAKVARAKVKAEAKVIRAELRLEEVRSVLDSSFL
jgi:hypothetical protein